MAGLIRRLGAIGSRMRFITIGPHAPSAGRTVIFYRNFQRFHGGHLKVWDYFNHALSAPGFIPFVRFTRDSDLGPTNPWIAAGLRRLERTERVMPDVIFVAGRDWSRISEPVDEAVPIINLIQHFRHTQEADLSSYLGRRAIRICVGPELAQAIRSVPHVSGPVIEIPNGVDLADVRASSGSRDEVTDVLVVANKQPEIGRRITDALSERFDIVLLDRDLDRSSFLGRLASAKVAVFAPNPQEGFYLPALEAMVLGTIVVCPDCLGNRSFCIPGLTAFRPDYREDDVVAQTLEALAMSSGDRRSMIDAAGAVAEAHDIAAERARFHGVLSRLDDLWHSPD